VSRHSALRDVVRAAGRHCPSSGFCIADAVEELMALPEEVRRAAARSRAEEFPWAATVAGFLAVHRLQETSSAQRRRTVAA
ncbi:MAG: glycosyltransferase family 1 protein, partial [Actinomycetes bacterium]